MTKNLANIYEQREEKDSLSLSRTENEQMIQEKTQRCMSEDNVNNQS